MQTTERISREETLQLSGPETYMLYLFEFEKPGWLICDFAWSLRYRPSFDLSETACDQVCRLLARRGILTCTNKDASPRRRHYTLVRKLDFSAAAWLLEEAKRKQWLGRGDDDKIILASLLNGGRGFPNSLASYSGCVWTAVGDFRDILDDGEVQKMDFPADTADIVYRIFASLLFCRGNGVVPILEDWHAKRPDGFEQESAASAIEYAALCTWSGRLDLLDILIDDKDPACREAHDFAEACRLLGEGDLAGAYKLTTFMGDFVSRSMENSEEILVSMPASHLLALAVTAFHKPAKSRIAKLALKLTPQAASVSNRLPGSASIYFDKRVAESDSILELVVGRISTDRENGGDWMSPFCCAGYVVQALTLDIGRNDVKRLAPLALRLAEKASRIGLPTLAGMYLSVFGWAFAGADAEKAKEIAKAVADANGAWFRPFESGSGSWRLAVEALDKCLPSAKKAAGGADGQRAKSGRIVWALTLVQKRDGRDEWDAGVSYPGPVVGGPVCVCINARPCFRGPRAPDDGAEDKPITYKAFLSGKYDEIVTETDRAVAAALQKASCFEKRKYLRAVPAEAVLPLCGHDGVVMERPDDKGGDPTFQSMTLVAADLPLAVKSAAGGGISITVEPWCLDVASDYAIRPLADGRIACYAFPKSARAVMDVFRAYGTGGALEIPESGMGAMRPLLPRMAALAPIQGDLAAVGGGADLERVSGDAVPLVRIEFEDGVLAMSLKAQPLAGTDLAFVPGAGQPERMVSLKGRTAVLVRDLAAERAAAEKVRAALADFDTWSEGEDLWRIDSLVHALRALAALKELGGAVRMEWRKGRRISVASPMPGSWRLTAQGGADFWFSVGGEFALDDGKALAISQLIAAFRERKDEFVPFGDGEYVRLTSALVRRLEALEAAGRVKGRALEVPAAALPMLDGVFGADGGARGGDAALALPQAMAERADAVRSEFARAVEPPQRLKAELRPYQREGYAWLSHLAACGFGSCLADDMGLGKTVQVIALLLGRAKGGASLVVAPASVCGNWRDELARFAPTLNVVMAWDEKADGMDAVNSAGAGDVVVAGYGLLVSREEGFAGREWNGVVLDEAQAIKNETSKRAKAVRRLRARFRVAATGTPVENRLTELWSICDFLNPGLLGTSVEFVRRFTSDGRAKPQLKRLVSPFVLRRVKRDVLEDLPEKTEITIPVELGEEERAGYETCRRMALDTLAAGGAENRISILAELTRLRRYCCHPSLVLGDAARESAKMDALVELLGDLRDNGHRALVFSQFTDYLAIVRGVVESHGWTHQYLDGQTPAAERGRLVDAFQRGEGDFFLISLKAGGTGLNLTAANYVILLDPWWNPAVENQAADRAHRIGQRNPVTVYRLIASDTVEERVVELHREKKAMAEDVLDGAGSSALTPEQLMGLFG